MITWQALAGVAGTVIILLLSILAFFLRRILNTIDELNGEVKQAMLTINTLTIGAGELSKAAAKHEKTLIKHADKLTEHEFRISNLEKQ